MLWAQTEGRDQCCLMWKVKWAPMTGKLSTGLDRGHRLRKENSNWGTSPMKRVYKAHKAKGYPEGCKWLRCPRFTQTHNWQQNVFCLSCNVWSNRRILARRDSSSQSVRGTWEQEKCRLSSLNWDWKLNRLKQVAEGHSRGRGCLGPGEARAVFMTEKLEVKLEPWPWTYSLSCLWTLPHRVPSVCFACTVLLNLFFLLILLESHEKYFDLYSILKKNSVNI